MEPRSTISKHLRADKESGLDWDVIEMADALLFTEDLRLDEEEAQRTGDPPADGPIAVGSFHQRS